MAGTRPRPRRSPASTSTASTCRARVRAGQALQTELVTATPLRFYVLREAGLRGGGMGSIGGRLVAEVFHRAIEGSNISILRDPFFSPTLGRVAGMLRMTDLFGLACNAPAGEIRPLSVNAPRPTAAQMQPSG